MEGEVNTQGKSINELNDCCLLNIFKFLYVPRDLVTVEKVCKRWKKIVSLAWEKVEIDEKDHEHLDAILKKCGHRVVNLYYFVTIPRQFGFPVLKIINKHCTKLLHLKVCTKAFFCVGDLTIKNLPFLKNLKSLHLDDFKTDFFDLNDYLNTVTKLMEDAKDLGEFSIKDSKEKKIKIKNNGKKIKICNFGHKKNLNLDRLLRRFPEVEDLKVCYVRDSWATDSFPDEVDIWLSDSTDFSLYQNLKLISNHLTSLDIKNISYNCFKGTGIKRLTFNRLKNLVIKKCPPLNDNLMSVFAKNCPMLENFDVSDCENVSDKGFCHLTSLNQLLVLSAESTKITGKTLELIAASCNKLQEMRSSSDLTASQLTNIVASLPNLKFMAMKSFDNMTEDGFRSVLKSVKGRENKMDLEIKFTVDGRPKNAEVFLHLKSKDVSSGPHNGLTITVISQEKEKHEIFGFTRLKKSDPQYYYIDDE